MGRLPTARVVFAIGLFARVGFVVTGDPLVTDRPDFTERAMVVGRGVLQVEGGGTFSDGDDAQATTGGEADHGGRC
jgi:hypothetical protein